jgi:transposase-like protein
MLKSHEECLASLEKIRWNGTPTCPYCEGIKSTKYKNEHRYRCNECFTSYSVTVGTLFHGTRVELHKWFRAIELLHTGNRKISVRQMALELQVHRATATLIIDRVSDASPDQQDLLQQIIHIFEK